MFLGQRLGGQAADPPEALRRVAVGAVLFGAVSILQLHAQAIGLGIPSQFLSALPYLITVVVLVAISRNQALLKVHAPACLGRTFVPEN